MTTAIATDSTGTATGRYLTFRIGDAFYAADVSKIERVLEVVPIMHVPGMPAFGRGVKVFEASADGTTNTIGALADAVDEVIGAGQLPAAV